MKKIKEQAENYAKGITKNETYQKYLIDAFLAGYKNKEGELQQLIKSILG